MKHIEIKDLLKNDLIVVELPDGWIFNTYKDQIGFCNELNIPMQQIKGSYTLLGKADEIREEDATELVQKIEYDFGTCYRHYVDKTVYAKTATESLLSAIETVAEVRTFDKSRTLIFVKN